jgi:hypothetical protein
MAQNKAFENFYRRQARRVNLILEKSRLRKWSINNQMGWRITDPMNNSIIAGPKWDLSIEEAAQILDDILDLAMASPGESGTEND